MAARNPHLWPPCKIMSRVPHHGKILLLMRHVHVFRFPPWHLLYHVTKVLHHGSRLSLRVSFFFFFLRGGCAVQRFFLMMFYYNVVVQCWHKCKFHLACITLKTHFGWASAVNIFLIPDMKCDSSLKVGGGKKRDEHLKLIFSYWKSPVKSNFSFECWNSLWMSLEEAKALNLSKCSRSYKRIYGVS